MTQEIKQRIEQIKRGEVPQGYKKTKVGIVPSEWETKKISQYIKLCERPIEMQDNTEYELVTVRRFYNGVDSRGLFLGSKILVKTQFKVKTGDFVISKRQISHGACGVLPKELNDSIVSNEYNVFVGINGTDTFFFNLYMQKPRCQNLFYLMSDGVHIEKLLFKTNQWTKQKIALPPLPEQKKIAEILTMQDRVIELQEKLIAEKQAQKKWLMQNLLVGKKRLSGFTEEWKKIKLKKILSERKLYSQKGLEYPHVTLSTNGIYAKSERYDRDHLVKDEEKEYKITRYNDICYNPANLKFGVICANKLGNAIFSPIYVTFEVGGNVNIDFIANYFTRCDFVNAVRKYEEGTVYERMAVKPADFLKHEIDLPPLPEQTAIAEILTTADKEIDLIKKNVEAEKQKKKALMQLLLTGIVRVNI